MTREQEVAWAAGLFEGEGCFTTSRTGKDKRRVTLHAILSSTDHDVVETFHRVVGVGTVFNAPRPSVKPAWIWRCSRIDDVRLVVDLFLPFLHARRSARAKEIIELWERNRAELTPHERSCPQCEGTFTPINNRAVYCSEGCTITSRNRRRALRERLGLVLPERQVGLF